LEFFDAIGKRIRVLREAKNLKLKDLAELIDISQGNLHSMENDKTNPSAAALKKLAAFFDVTSDWILFGPQLKEEGAKYDTGFHLTVPDMEMAMYFSKIIDEWKNGDARTKNWVMVQLERSFPEVADRIRQEKRK
jgi:transcriptional regulator with XRE-family HTH domain